MKKSKFGNRKYTKAEWKKWKRAQRKYPSPPGKKGKVRRHHTGSGDNVILLSPKRHAAKHKKTGTQGGRGRKKK